MVSGKLFHCRKNSWPPEEYINRTTLQLLDSDSASPPSQAWRRKLNTHASILKEFTITFSEAIKMIRLGIRLWSYVREEASHGRKAPIDPFTRERCRPSASLGAPLGGMGSGSISRGFRGEFRHFQILPAECETPPVMANQFSVKLFPPTFGLSCCMYGVYIPESRFTPVYGGIQDDLYMQKCKVHVSGCHIEEVIMELSLGMLLKCTDVVFSRKSHGMLLHFHDHCGLFLNEISFLSYFKLFSFKINIRNSMLRSYSV